MGTEMREPPEKVETTEKRNPPGTGEQYLLALIKCAGWVDKPYKQLAEKHRMNTEVLKELYLCACDGVPIEEAVKAQKKKPIEEALQLTRRKHLADESVVSQQGELSSIKKTTDVLEKEVRQMFEMLQHISNHVPNFDSMFPEDIGTAEDKIQNRERLPEQETELTEFSVPDKPEGEVHKKQKKPELNVPKSGTFLLKKIKEYPWIKKRAPADFIKKSLDAGYSKEQLEYLLDCIEEGIEIEKIEKFTSPKLPVDVMRRLRMLEEREENERESKGE